MKGFLKNALRWLIAGAVALIIAACYGAPVMTQNDNAQSDATPETSE